MSKTRSPLYYSRGQVVVAVFIRLSAGLHTYFRPPAAISPRHPPPVKRNPPPAKMASIPNAPGSLRRRPEPPNGQREALSGPSGCCGGPAGRGRDLYCSCHTSRPGPEHSMETSPFTFQGFLSCGQPPENRQAAAPPGVQRQEALRGGQGRGWGVLLDQPPAPGRRPPAGRLRSRALGGAQSRREPAGRGPPVRPGVPRGREGLRFGNGGGGVRPGVGRRGPRGGLGTGDGRAGGEEEVRHGSSLLAGLPAGWEGRIPSPISHPPGASISARRTHPLWVDQEVRSSGFRP